MKNRNFQKSLAVHFLILFQTLVTLSAEDNPKSIIDISVTRSADIEKDNIIGYSMILKNTSKAKVILDNRFGDCRILLILTDGYMSTVAQGEEFKRISQTGAVFDKPTPPWGPAELELKPGESITLKILVIDAESIDLKKHKGKVVLSPRGIYIIENLNKSSIVAQFFFPIRVADKELVISHTVFSGVNELLNLTPSPVKVKEGWSARQTIVFPISSKEEN